MLVEKIMTGDLVIKKEYGGNDKHKGFWHRQFCWCVHSTSETIFTNPSYTVYKTYYKCGYWEKETLSCEKGVK